MSSKRALKLQLLRDLPDEAARVQLRQFLTLGWIVVLVAFFLYAWLAIVSLAFSVRCLMLAYHPGNAKLEGVGPLRAWTIMLILLSGYAVMRLFYAAS
jgi:hypothetical protein